MKNQLIYNLVSAGVLNTTCYDLPASQAYKALKFRNALSKAYEGIIESVKKINETVGIKEEQEFLSRNRELLKKENRTEEENIELEQSKETLKKRGDLVEELFKDDTPLEGIKTMPFEDFFALQKENKSVGQAPFRVFETELEGVLWETPQDT